MPGLVLKILMRQKVFLDQKRHDCLIMVQKLILKVFEKAKQKGLRCANRQ